MSIKVPLVGEQRLLQIVVASWGTLTLHLYQNNVVPGPGDNISTYTECTFSGYTPQNLGGWTAPAPDGAGRYVTQASPVTFTVATGGVTNMVYGYYVTDSGGNLIFSEIFASAPISMANPGQQLQVTPTFTDKSEF